MFHVTTRYAVTRYTLSGLPVFEFVDREIAMSDIIESFGHLPVGLMSHVLEVLLYYPSSPPLSTLSCLCPLTEPR